MNHEDLKQWDEMKVMHKQLKDMSWALDKVEPAMADAFRELIEITGKADDFKSKQIRIMELRDKEPNMTTAESDELAKLMDYMLGIRSKLDELRVVMQKSQ